MIEILGFSIVYESSDSNFVINKDYFRSAEFKAHVLKVCALLEMRYEYLTK